MDIESSDSASKDAFWMTEVEESQGSSWPCSWEIPCETTTTRQVTVKPLIHTEGLYVDFFFSPLNIFC